MVRLVSIPASCGGEQVSHEHLVTSSFATEVSLRANTATCDGISFDAQED